MTGAQPTTAERHSRKGRKMKNERCYTMELVNAENEIREIRASLPSFSKIMPAGRRVIDKAECDTIIRADHYLTEALNTIREYLNRVENENA